MNKISLYIFDLDGTLFNTLRALNIGMNYMLTDFNLPNIDVEDTRKFVGYGYRIYVERALDKAVEMKKLKGETYAHDRNDIIEKACECYLKHFRQHCNDEVVPYENVVSTLKKLKLSGAKLAILTNKAMHIAEKNVNSQVGPDMFDLVYGECEYISRKPDPMGIYKIMEELGVNDRQSVMMIGDTGVDIETGKNAGVKTCAVTWGFREKDELEKLNPDYIIEDMSKLLKFI